MNRLLTLCAIALSAAIAFAPRTASAAIEKTHYEMVSTTLTTHILPRIAAMKAAGKALPASVDKVCTSGSPASRRELLAKFRSAVSAYAAIDYLRFGPFGVPGRREAISFWPDPRGFVARQLKTLIASNDEKATTQKGIAAQSAAIEGLPALELLITDSEHRLGPGDDAAYRCKIAKAIAENVAAIGDSIDADWTKDGGWKDKMLRPGSDNDVYKEPQEAASELVKALLTGLALIADVQIKPRLAEGYTGTGPYGKTKLASLYFASEVDSLNALYTTIGLQSFVGDDKAWMRAWADNAWQTMQASDGFGGRAKDARRGDKPRLREVFDKITGLRKLVSKEMAPSAGLAVGFNELDGD